MHDLPSQCRCGFNVGAAIIKKHDVSRCTRNRPGKSFINLAIRLESTQQMGGVGKSIWRKIGQRCISSQWQAQVLDKHAVVWPAALRSTRAIPLPPFLLDPSVVGARNFFYGGIQSTGHGRKEALAVQVSGLIVSLQIRPVALLDHSPQSHRPIRGNPNQDLSQIKAHQHDFFFRRRA